MLIGKKGGFPILPSEARKANTGKGGFSASGNPFTVRSVHAAERASEPKPRYCGRGHHEHRDP
jgi:hypothetical protein